MWGTDFSRGAGRVEGYAALLARTYGTELRLLHVAQPYPTLAVDAVSEIDLLEPVHRDVSHALDDMAVRLRERGLQVSATQAEGIPSEEIIAAARTDGADFILLGSQGRTALEHVLVGSTAERVIKGAPCPVLTVHAGEANPKSSVIRHIVVPLDFSKGSADALEAAIVLAHTFEASITLLHVLEWSWLRLHYTIAQLADEERIRQDLDIGMEPYVEAVRSEGLKVETVVLGCGGPGDFIVETA